MDKTRMQQYMSQMRAMFNRFFSAILRAFVQIKTENPKRRKNSSLF